MTACKPAPDLWLWYGSVQGTESDSIAIAYVRSFLREAQKLVQGPIDEARKSLEAAVKVRSQRMDVRVCALFIAALVCNLYPYRPPSRRLTPKPMV